MTSVDKQRDLRLLEIVLDTAVEDALTQWQGDSTHYVYQGGVPETYEVQEEIPADRSVILKRQSDGAKFRVGFSVYVEEM